MKCLICNKESEKKFCSTKCQYKYYNKLRSSTRDLIKNCNHCGKEYKPFNTIQKFCSNNCKLKAESIRLAVEHNIVNCIICNKEFTQKRKDQINCSKKCKTIHENKKKSNKPEISTCNHCNKEFSPYTKYNKFCSSACRINNIKAKRSKNWNEIKVSKITGINNPAYRNGMYIRENKKTTKNERLFQSNRDLIKQKMIDSEGYIYCQYCNTSNSLRFEGHHIVYRSEKPNHENIHHIDNIIILCIKCHNDFHKHKGLRNKIVEKRKLNLLFDNQILNK